MENKFEVLGDKHKKKKKEFECSNPELTKYLREQAGQDSRNDFSQCFVLVNENEDILGYFTLCLDTELRENLKPQIKGQISYPKIGMILIGRLAVSKNHSSKGYGKALILEAIKRSMKVYPIIKFKAIVVDPKDKSAISFYKKFGFISLESKNRMFITSQTLLDL